MFISESKRPHEAASRALILRALSEHFPQSISEIHTVLREKYRRKLSYQAVRKLVRKLAEEKILETSAKKYLVSKRWLLQARKEIDALIVKYQDELPGGTPRSARISSEYGNYHFTSLYELDNFWGDLVLDYCARIRTRPRPPFFSVTPYGWWMLINLGRETNFWMSMKRFGFPVTLLLCRDNPLNRWAHRVYKHIGVSAFVRTEETIGDTNAYNIVGDLVIQVSIDKSSAEAVRSCYKKFRRVDHIKPEILEHLAHGKFQSTLSVFRNPALAQTLRVSMGLC